MLACMCCTSRLVYGAWQSAWRFTHAAKKAPSSGPTPTPNPQPPVAAVALSVVVGVVLIASLAAGARRAVKSSGYQCSPEGGGKFDLTFFVVS